MTQAAIAVAQNIRKRWKGMSPEARVCAAGLFAKYSPDLLDDEVINNLVELLYTELYSLRSEDIERTAQIFALVRRPEIRELISRYDSLSFFGRNVAVLLAGSYPSQEVTEWLLQLSTRGSGLGAIEPFYVIKSVGEHIRYYLDTGIDDYAVEVTRRTIEWGKRNQASLRGMIDAFVPLLAYGNREIIKAVIHLVATSDELEYFGPRYIAKGLFDAIRRQKMDVGQVMELLDSVEQKQTAQRIALWVSRNLLNKGGIWV